MKIGFNKDLFHKSFSVFLYKYLSLSTKNINKILFLTTAHHFNDDRIFYHQAKELKNKGFDVKICSLSSDFVGNIDGVEIESYPVIEKSFSEKIEIFQRIIEEFQPDCIVGSEPLAIISAKNYKKKRNINVMYDVTEWYPSKRMVENYSFFIKIFHAIKFFIIQLYSGLISTHFIFGENTKKFPLAYVFPFKKQIVLPYYPSEKYVYPSLKKLEHKKIKLCYAGVFSKEKGIGNFFEAVHNLCRKRPDIEIFILLIGASRKYKDKIYFENLLKKYQFKNIEIKKPTSFETVTQSYSEADICFDLRELNFENNHCLPIKIFYYAASGKPVIYTNLKATREHIEVSKFGYLVNPEDAGTISNLISKYVDNPELYYLHAQNSRKLFEEKYNWDLISNSFSDFVRQSIQ